MSRYLRTENELTTRKEQLIEVKKSELTNFVDIAYKTIEASYKKSQSKDEIKLRAGDKLEQTTNVIISLMDTYYNQNKNVLSESDCIPL